MPILDRFVYENPHPDWVVLVEETIIKAVNFFRGTPDGTGCWSSTRPAIPSTC